MGHTHKGGPSSHFPSWDFCTPLKIRRKQQTITSEPRNHHNINVYFSSSTFTNQLDKISNHSRKQMVSVHVFHVLHYGSMLLR